MKHAAFRGNDRKQSALLRFHFSSKAPKIPFPLFPLLETKNALRFRFRFLLVSCFPPYVWKREKKRKKPFVRLAFNEA